VLKYDLPSSHVPPPPTNQNSPQTGGGVSKLQPIVFRGGGHSRDRLNSAVTYRLSNIPKRKIMRVDTFVFRFGFGYPATAVSGQRIHVGYVRIIFHVARATAVRSFAAGARVSGSAEQDGRRSYFIFCFWFFF